MYSSRGSIAGKGITRVIWTLFYKLETFLLLSRRLPQFQIEVLRELAFVDYREGAVGLESADDHVTKTKTWMVSGHEDLEVHQQPHWGLLGVIIGVICPRLESKAIFAKIDKTFAQQKWQTYILKSKQDKLVSPRSLTPKGAIKEGEGNDCPSPSHSSWGLLWNDL